MAQTWFVDAAQADNLNGGSSAGAAKVSGAAAVTDGTATVQLDAASDLSTVVVGDVIRIHGRVDGIRSTDLFEITAKDDDADTVDVTPSPGAAVDQAWRIGGAFKTIQRAASVEEAGDRVWIKGGVDYTEAVSGLGFGNPNEVIVWAGYTNTPGDNGEAVINGQGARTVGLSFNTTNQTCHTFRNLAFINHTQYGAGGGANARFCSFLSCRFEDNTLGGLNPGAAILCAGCLFTGGAAGLVPGTTTTTYIFQGCRFTNLSAFGVEEASEIGVIALGCHFQDCDGGAIQRTNGDAIIVISGCTIQGGGTMGDAFDLVGAANFPAFPVLISNNIISGCTRGITGTSNGTTPGLSLHNLFFDNDDDKVTFDIEEAGEITGQDPAFVSPTDPSLLPSSPAHNHGFGITEAPDWDGSGEAGPIGVVLGVEGSGSSALSYANPFYPLTIPGQ